ncbi:MAG: DinB family protein [Acidobacteriota bacterium]
MKTIDSLVSMRRALEKMTRSMSEEERLTVPEGFNNHVLWHLGHLVVTQQMLCYQLGGLKAGVEPAWVPLFKNGSAPRDWPSDAEIPSYETLLESLHELAAKTRTDYDAGFFADFVGFDTGVGPKVESIENALVFNNFHEGLHFGYVMAMRRVLASGG